MITRGNNRGSRLQSQFDVTLHADAPRKILSCRQPHRSAPFLRTRFNSLVNRRRVQCLSVPLGPEVPHVKNALCISAGSRQDDEQTK